jgi:ribosomal protein S18 acetylase RimI-like enzyme
VRVVELEPDQLAAVREAADLFDDDVDDASAAAFLEDPRHHLLIAYEDERPVGFLSAIELLHPDKSRPEMFVYELAVDEGHRRRGAGSSLVRRVAEICVERGCREMFVLTDDANEAALATYRKSGGSREPDSVMFLWSFPETRAASGAGQPAGGGSDQRG